MITTLGGNCQAYNKEWVFSRNQGIDRDRIEQYLESAFMKLLSGKQNHARWQRLRNRAVGERELGLPFMLEGQGRFSLINDI